MPSTKIDYEKIAQSLVSSYHKLGFPGDNKPMAYAVRFDGSLSVVAANGQKFIFSKGEVDQAQEELKSLQKPPGRPRKTVNARSGRPGGRETAQEPKKTG